MKPTVERLTGFGGRDPAAGYVLRPRSAEEVADAFARGEKIALRGAGRSYGDAATHREGLVLDLSHMSRVLSFDARNGLIELEGGATMETLWRTALPLGWWPKVITGTMRPTIGGAIGMNVHGKNALRTGTLGEHVTELDLLTPDGELRTLRPQDPEFGLVFGSAGMLGVVTRAMIQLRPVVSGRVRVTARRASGWDEDFARFAEVRGSVEYLVATVDLLAPGEQMGRGYVQAADWVEEPEPATLAVESQVFRDTLPSRHAWRALKMLTKPAPMRLLNARAARTPERTKTQGIVPFTFPLDSIPHFNRAYGAGGFIQYQSFVPAAHAREVFARQGAMLHAAGLPAYLSVLKIHRRDALPLSYGLDGYSLALDIPTTPASWPLVQRTCWVMNDDVLAHGGRFYLAKDSTLRPEDARAYLGTALDDLAALKARWDPKGLLTSDLARRLRLFD